MPANYPNDGRNSTPMPHSGTITIIGGVRCVDPAVCKITLSDIHSSDSGRNEAAEMREMVIAKAKNIHFEFKNIDPEDAAEILAVISTGRHYIVQAYDPVSKLQADGEYYSGDRTFDMQQWMEDRYDGKTVNLSFDCLDAKPKRMSTSPEIPT